MMFFIIVAVTFSVMGLILCSILSNITGRHILKKCHEIKSFSDELKTKVCEGTSYFQKTHSEHMDVYFDHTRVTVGKKMNDSLEQLFDLIIGNYVDSWYKSLSTNPDFTIQIKVFLQYLCAVIVHRAKNVNFTAFITDRCIPHFFDHIARILFLSHDKQQYSIFHDDKTENLANTCTTATHNKNFSEQTSSCLLPKLSDEDVLCGLGSHIHTALHSRHSELVYLRSLVNRLLPLLSLPPSLSFVDHYQSEQSSPLNFVSALPVQQESLFTPLSRHSSDRHNRYKDNINNTDNDLNNHNHGDHCAPNQIQNKHNISTGFVRSASSGALFSKDLVYVKLGSNPSAYSFLVEILSTCVLLPAMDTLANSDFINQLILLYFSGISDDNTSILDETSEYVPVLNSYLHDWKKWLVEKHVNLDLNKLLCNQDDLYPFMQYMKSVKSSGPLTVILLMHQINSRISNPPLLPDACSELSAQIKHILAMLYGHSNNSSRLSSANNSFGIDHNDQNQIGNSNESYSISQSTHNLLSFVTIPNGFEKLLKETMNDPKPEIYMKLIKNSEWKNVYNAVHEAIQSRFLPMYVESPEYVRHVLGITHRSSSVSSINRISMSPNKLRSGRQRLGQSTQKPYSHSQTQQQHQKQQPGLLESTLLNVFGVQSVDGQFMTSFIDLSKPSTRRSNPQSSNTSTTDTNSDSNSASSTASTNTNIVYSSNENYSKDRHLNEKFSLTSRALISSSRSSSSSVTTNNNNFSIISNDNNNDSGTITSDEHIISNQSISHVNYSNDVQTIDLSNWRVFIRGLSRPEIQNPSKRILGAIANVASSPIGTNMYNSQSIISSNHIMHTLTSSLSSTALSTSVINLTGTRDAVHKNKIAQELINLHNPYYKTSALSTTGNNSSTNTTTSTSSSFLPQLSPQFMFHVLTECVVNNVRKHIARVNRKYSEFYVLEQKLIEFHGSLITKLLPRKQLNPRTIEFLESKCEMFEDYLQYLVSQPFLRNSKLLYSFLTSDEPFTTNLFELNLGRLVKSMPLKLSKEKGQYLDDFLLGYYISCHPQPIDANVQQPSINNDNNNFMASLQMLTNESQLSSETIESTDLFGHLNIPTSKIKLNAQNVSRSRHNSTIGSTCEKYDKLILKSQNSNLTTNSNQSLYIEKKKRTTLDHRLRSRLYWNNAGLNNDNMKTKKQPKFLNELCDFTGINFDGPMEMIIYLLDRIYNSSVPNPDTQSSSILPNQLESKLVNLKSRMNSSENNKNKLQSSKSSACTTTTVTSQITNDKIPNPWDLTHSLWGEALLNAPIIPTGLENKLITSTTTNATTTTTINNGTLDNPQSDVLLTFSESKLTNSTQNNVTLSLSSIKWNDLKLALQEFLYLLIKQFKSKLYYSIMNILILLKTYFQKRIDHWLTEYLTRNLSTKIFTDRNFSSILQLIKTNAFFSSSNNNTIMEKSELKEKAQIMIEEAVQQLGFDYLIEPDQLRRRIQIVFECFQHPKWNKQLTYVLLDQLILELFPELDSNSTITNATEI